MPRKRREACEYSVGVFLRRRLSAAGELPWLAHALPVALFFSTLLLIGLPSSLCGKGLPAPNPIFSAPDTAYFGLTRVGNCDTLLLPITNNGADSLVIDSVLFSSDSSSLFLISGLKGVPLGSGSTQSVRVGFCPDDTSCVVGVLVIYAHSEVTGGPVIVHRIGLGGCGGTPFLKVDSTALMFDSVSLSKCRRDSFTVANLGNYPLRITEMPTSNPGFTVVDPTQFPVILPPYSSRRVVVEFCPTKGTFFFDSLLIISDAGGRTLHLSGQGYLRQLLLPPLFDVGTVRLGECLDTFLVVKNSGTLPITLAGASLADLSLPSGFSLKAPVPLRRLLPGDTMRIDLRFCPESGGEHVGSLRLKGDADDDYVALLLGKGLRPFFWLDTADAAAGELVTLTFRLGPGDPVGTGNYRVEFVFNPDALFPVSGASAAPGGSVAISRPGKGILLIEGTRSAPLSSDGSLFTVLFRGLSSGEPANRVAITNLNFPTSPPQWDTLHGMVRLSGCEVGRTPGASKRAHITSLGPNPAGESTLLRYQAPQGRISSLTIFDADGGRIKSLDLPEGTGEAQEFRLDLTDLPRGLYMMELREREERSWRILLIDR